jgi:hypothetical protein
VWPVVRLRLLLDAFKLLELDSAKTKGKGVQGLLERTLTAVWRQLSRKETRVS